MNVVPLRKRAADGIPGDFATLIPEFLDHKRARGAAVNTLDAYRRDLCLLRDYCGRFDVSLVQLVSERILNRWLDDGILHLQWTRRTAARRLACVRSFLAWTRSEGYTQHDATEHVQVRFRPKQVIAPELEPLKGVIASIGTVTPIDLRDRAMFMLLLDAALRASEVVTLDVFSGEARRPTYCVDTRTGRVYVRPKGGDEDESEVVGLEDQTVAAVKAWLRVRHKMAHPDSPALFVNQVGGRISRQTLYITVRERGVAAGISKLHPHLFRHRRLGEIVEKIGLDAGCAQARHKQKSTTANVYGAHAAEVQRGAIRNLCPLGEVRA